MHLTAKRRLISAAAAGFVAAALGGVVWSLGPVESSADAPQHWTASAPVAETDDAGTTTTAIGGDVDWSVPLQQPLYTPPKPEPTRPKPTPPAARTPRPKPSRRPKLNWKLVGTIIDAEASVAIFADADGKTDIRREGETVDLAPSGVSVRKIDSDRVTLDVGGDESTLQLQQSFSSDSGRPRGPRRRNR